MGEPRECVNCGKRLIKQGGAWLCVQCNSRDIDATQIFLEDGEDRDHVFIDCPGASLYEPGTNQVVEGVEFYDNDDPCKGYRMIGQAVYAPNHRRRRRIKREALGKIRRCQACQDYTVRMRRPEGRDFFIPSSRHPGRKKLKAVEHVTYEP